MTEDNTPTPKKMKKKGEIFTYKQARDQRKLKAADEGAKSLDLNVPSTPS